MAIKGSSSSCSIPLFMLDGIPQVCELVLLSELNQSIKV